MTTGAGRAGMVSESMAVSDTDIAAGADEIRRMANALEAQVPALASSLDGITFRFIAPVSEPLQAGGYVSVETPAAAKLGQIRELFVDRVEGPELLVKAGTVTGRTHVPFDRLAGSGTMLESAQPFHGAPLARATAGAMRKWSARVRPPGGTLAIGEATLAPGVAVNLDARGFGRHTFLCGQSGSGKSYTMGLLLEQLLLETTLPIIVLDPNSDATELREPRSGVEPVAAERWRRVAAGIAIRGLGRDGPERLRLRFFDLDLATQEALLGLDPLEDREEFDALRVVLEADAAGRSVSELERLVYESPEPKLRALALRIRNLGVLDWPVWSRDPTDSGLLGEIDDGDWRCLVVDLGSVEVPAERSLVSAAVLSRLWARRADRRPVLVVVDEAHNICPPVPGDRLTAVATDQAVTIAAEGRKFGLHLLVATQRPLKVHENVLSQCDNLFLMRVNSKGDLARICELFSFAPVGLIGRAATSGLGQALVCGRIASHPTFVTTGGRIAREGGADAPADWARRRMP